MAKNGQDAFAPITAAAMAVVLALTCAAAGQTNGVQVTDWFAPAFSLLEHAIGRDAVSDLKAMNTAELNCFLSEVSSVLGSADIRDLASASASAHELATVLESWSETQPYGSWLKSRLEYFDAAEAFIAAVPPGDTVPLCAAPGQDEQRLLWYERLAGRPAPAGAEKLVPVLKPVFRAHSVPEQLVWIAEVESSFDARARSPSGAVGLFQFKAATARAMGLSTAPFDERVVPSKSAAAAARYLAYLHGRFGDWFLALAAYNAGEGRLKSAMDRHSVRTFREVASKLPVETQMYVPKIDAVLTVREGTGLAMLPPPGKQARQGGGAPAVRR
ncbi:MAG: lytic transglycosylase domain-containing protein [Lentisphaerae bacterium]|nr:lytic transglycosylase domain-containing protein [Lentisphaerota bacterium]